MLFVFNRPNHSRRHALNTVHTDTELTQLFSQCMFEQTTTASQHSTELTLSLAREMYAVITHQLHAYTEESVQQKIQSLSTKTAERVADYVPQEPTVNGTLLDERINTLTEQLTQLESALSLLQSQVNSTPDAIGALRAVFGNLCDSTHATLDQYSAGRPQSITSGTQVNLQRLNPHQVLITVTFTKLPSNLATLTLINPIPLPVSENNLVTSYLYTGDLETLANQVATVTGDETYTFVIPPVSQYPVSFNFT